MSVPPGPVLRDIHMPPAPGWWPPAPGWWGLGLLVVLILAALAWRRWRGRTRRRYWLEISSELEQLVFRHASDNDDGAFAAGVSQLLRRVARLGQPGAVSAAGEDWHAVLRKLAPDPASAQILQHLDDSIYRPNVDVDAPVIAASARRWLQHVLLRGGRHA